MERTSFWSGEPSARVAGRRGHRHEWENGRVAGGLWGIRVVPEAVT